MKARRSVPQIRPQWWGLRGFKPCINDALHPKPTRRSIFKVEALSFKTIWRTIYIKLENFRIRNESMRTKV